MLRLVCESRRRGRWTRREWLRLGGLGGLAGLAATPGLAIPPAARSPGFGRARSVILVYASGGQSQLDMWDPKPLAPADVRGEFAPLKTVVPGVALTEHLPRLAALADRYTLVRSMSHEDLDHGSATYLALTGRYHRQRSANPDPSPQDLPTCGAVLRRVQHTSRFPYEAIHLNGPALVPVKLAPGQNAGLLGREFEPLVLGDVNRQSVALPGLQQRDELATVRLRQRQSLKDSLDRLHGQLESLAQSQDLSRLYRQALEILDSPHCRRAFNLHEEPAALRARYGRNRSGQACLLARRLVEAGVPWITVIWSHSNRGQDLAPQDTDAYGWDTHNDIFQALKGHLLPRFDLGLSALIEDLDQRGLLDQTLLVCMGEFGRAPRVALEPRFQGRSPGRTHWASVYSILMAGAGVSRGAVLGRSDRFGAEPVGERYGPWDVTATLFAGLGIDPAGHYQDALSRPFPISIGQPMTRLYQG